MLEQTLGHITHTANLHAPRRRRRPRSTPRSRRSSSTSTAGRRASRGSATGRSAPASGPAGRSARLRRGGPARRPLHPHPGAGDRSRPTIIRRIPTVVSLDATPIQYDELGAHYGHGTGDRRASSISSGGPTGRASRGRRRSWRGRSGRRPGSSTDYEVAAGQGHRDPARASTTSTGPPSATRARRRERGRAVRVLFVGGDLARKGGLVARSTPSGALRAGRASTSSSTSSPATTSPPSRRRRASTTAGAEQPGADRAVPPRRRLLPPDARRLPADGAVRSRRRRAAARVDRRRRHRRDRARRRDRPARAGRRRAALAAALRRLAGDPTLRHRLGDGARDARRAPTTTPRRTPRRLVELLLDVAAGGHR